MMRIIQVVFFSIFLSCVPKIEKGPIPVEEASKPVQVIEMGDPNNPNLYLHAIIRAGSSMDPIGKEGLANLTAQSLVHAGGGEFGQILRLLRGLRIER